MHSCRRQHAASASDPAAVLTRLIYLYFVTFLCPAGKGGAAAGGLDAASMRQLMGRPDGPPVRYLMTQLTGFNQPLTYPDHGGVMELRNAKHR
jgi:hypothetical protein